MSDFPKSITFKGTVYSVGDTVLYNRDGGSRKVMAASIMSSDEFRRDSGKDIWLGDPRGMPTIYYEVNQESQLVHVVGKRVKITLTIEDD